MLRRSQRAIVLSAALLAVVGCKKDKPRTDGPAVSSAVQAGGPAAAAGSGPLASSAAVTAENALGKKASVRTGAVQVIGKLKSEEIKTVVQADLDGVRLCYGRALARTPTLAGRLAVKLLIDPNGAVVSATQASTDVPDTEFVECVLDTFKKLSFPKPEGGSNVVVNYPFLFKPGD